MKIYGLNKTTLLDYPGRVACTVFLGGCNMRCLYCHNSSLVLHPETQPEISEEYFFSFLNKRRNILKGVCITGGEPTLATDLRPFILKIKSFNLSVKLDTNGLNPNMIRSLLDDNLIDYIAMDIKGPIKKYDNISGISNIDITKISDSVNIIMNSSIDYEFRTTVVDELLDDSDFSDIGSWLNGAKAYYLQPYKDSDNVMTQNLTAPDEAKLKRYSEIVKQYIPNTIIRGM